MARTGRIDLRDGAGLSFFSPEMRANLTGVLFILICAAANLCPAQTASPAKHSDALIVVPGAIRPDYVNLSGDRQQLSYTIKLQYPARDVLSVLANQLTKRNWKPLKEDFLNPGLPTSNVRGWTFFEDGTEHPAAYVRQWMGDWANEAHDMVTYVLQYRSADTSTRDLRTLQVIAIYIPARTVAEMKRAMAAQRTKHPSESANH